MPQLDCPRYIFFESRLSAERFLSNEINNYVRLKPHSILSFEANEDFANLYESIAKRALETQTSYKNVVFFSPSETCPNDVNVFDLTSYNFLSHTFVSKTDINPENFYCLFDSNYVQTPGTELIEFDNYLKQNGDIDILLLSVSEDGTLLMNFPQTDLFSKSRVISYTPSIDINNSNYFQTEQNLNNEIYPSQIENQYNVGDNQDLPFIDVTQNDFQENNMSQIDNQQLYNQENFQTDSTQVDNQYLMNNQEMSAIDPLFNSQQLPEESVIGENNLSSNSICWATLGLEMIKRSKKIYLLIFGERKSELLSNFFFGNGFDSNLPVSCLRENPNTTVIADLAAAKIVLSYAEKN